MSTHVADSYFALRIPSYRNVYHSSAWRFVTKCTWLYKLYSRDLASGFAKLYATHRPNYLRVYFFVRHCATSGKVEGSIPDMGFESFYFFNLASYTIVTNRNKYQESFLVGVKAAGAYGWQPCHLYVLIVWKLWKPQPPGAVGDYLDLYRNSFIFLICVFFFLGYLFM